MNNILYSKLSRMIISNPNVCLHILQPPTVGAPTQESVGLSEGGGNGSDPCDDGEHD